MKSITQYERLISYFNEDNPDGDGFYLDTDLFFFDMDEYKDEHGVKYHAVHVEDKSKRINTRLSIYNPDTVYVTSSVGDLLLDESRLYFVFKMLNMKIEQMREQMLKNVEILLNK